MRRGAHLAGDGAGGRGRRHRLHDLAADREPRVRGRGARARRSSACWPRRCRVGRRRRGVFSTIRRLPHEVRARQLGRHRRRPRRSRRRGRPGARPRPRLRRCARHAGRVRRLRVPLLRPGRGGDPRAARLVRRRPALRVAAPAAERRPPQRADWRPRRPRPPPPRARSGRCTTSCSTIRTSSAPRPASLRATSSASTRSASGRVIATASTRSASPTTSRARTRAACRARRRFFINGRRHEGAYDIEHLSSAVRAARWRAEMLQAAPAGD